MWLLHIQLGQLTAKSSTVHISQVMKTARALSAIGNIPQVLSRLKLSGKYRSLNFGKKLTCLIWKNSSCYSRFITVLDKTDRKPYYVNFEDRILSTVHETTAFCRSTIFGLTMKKVEHYLKTHLDEESISKLYHNKS